MSNRIGRRWRDESVVVVVAVVVDGDAFVLRALQLPRRDTFIHLGNGGIERRLASVCALRRMRSMFDFNCLICIR